MVSYVQANVEGRIRDKIDTLQDTLTHLRKSVKGTPITQLSELEETLQLLPL